MDTYFKLVEKTLSKYPISWQKNYYENKLDLVIEHKKGEIESSADYDHDKNIITLYDNNDKALVHELFHMSFRDKEKVGKEIEEDCIYGNGVSFKEMETGAKHLHSITEGFAEYLARLCLFTYKGHPVAYFFIDLLIKIYGEEILEYLFCNDPLGFIFDSRFYNIVNFSQALDCYYGSTDVIALISDYSSTLKKIMRESEMERKKVIECIEQNTKEHNESLIRTFSAIIEEYQSYKHHLIEKDLFIKQLSSFLVDPDYSFVFTFDDDYIVRKKLQTSIDLIK